MRKSEKKRESGLPACKYHVHLRNFTCQCTMYKLQEDVTLITKSACMHMISKPNVRLWVQLRYWILPDESHLMNSMSCPKYKSLRYASFPPFHANETSGNIQRVCSMFLWECYASHIPIWTKTKTKVGVPAGPWY